MVKIIFPEPDALAVDEKLSEEQIKAIDEIKSAPWDAPKESAKAEDKPEEKEPEVEKKPEPEKEGEENKDAEKTPEELAAEKQAKEAEAAETVRLDKKAKELSKTVEEVKQLETDEKADKERVEKIAKDEGLTVEEVRESEAKDLAVAERHGKDPVKIARALRKEQSEYGKLKNEVDGLRKFKNQVEIQATKFNDQRFEAIMEKDRDRVIDTFREKYPDESAELSDDAIFERGKAIIRKGLEEREKVQSEKMKTDAETKRVEILKSLPEEFKDFIPEVKELLTECGNEQILDAEFDVSFLANYSRGKKHSSEYIKALEDAAYKRGVEQSKILPKVPAGKPNIVKKGSVDLTEKQKLRAEEIYGRREGWSKEKMYEEFAKSDLKEDSKW